MLTWTVSVGPKIAFALGTSIMATREIAHTAWREELDASPRRMDPRALAHEIAGLDLANAALIDCTAAASIVDAYPEFVRANLHVVTPNKQANVLPMRRWQALQDLLRARRKHFLYEANVGAGLPVISTLRAPTSLLPLRTASITWVSGTL